MDTSIGGDFVNDVRTEVEFIYVAVLNDLKFLR